MPRQEGVALTNRLSVRVLHIEKIRMSVGKHVDRCLCVYADMCVFLGREPSVSKSVSAAWYVLAPRRFL